MKKKKKHLGTKGLRRYADQNRLSQNRVEIVLLGRLYESFLGPKWQYIIHGYIVDFAWPSYRLIVEVDGPYHETDTQAAKDEVRQRKLEGHGWLVKRVTDDEVLANPARVVEHINQWLKSRENLKWTPASPSAYQQFAPCWAPRLVKGRS